MEYDSRVRSTAMDSSLKYDMELINSSNLFSSMNISEDKIVLVQQLKNLHCPFSWEPKQKESDTRGHQVLLATEKKLRGAEDEGEECTPWTKFVLNLVVCYEKAVQGSITEAFQKQDECQKILKGCSQLPHMPAMGIGLNHVCLACKMYLLFKIGRFEEVSKMLREVKSLDDMNPRDQASVWAVRGAVFLEYGSKGQKESIEFIERAIELDSQCGEMHFLLGKALSRARRNEFRKVPTGKEIESFELAVALTGDKFYKVLLAQSYFDKSMYEKASEIYRNVIEDETANPYILARCGFGLMKMRKPWQDLNLAEKIVRKAIQKTSSNGFLYITAGRLYLMKNQFEEAEKYFSREAENGNFEAVKWLIITREKKNRSYTAVSDLERFIELECYSEMRYKNDITLLIGLYYFVKQRNFDKALEYWWKVIRTDTLSDSLNNLVNPWNYKFNINAAIIKEIGSRMRSDIPGRKKTMYMEVLKFYQERCPELLPHHLQVE